MKKSIIFVFLLVISMCISAQDYHKLWKEFDDDIENLLPESAGKILDKIEKQALKDKNDVQLLKMALRRCETFNMNIEFPDDTVMGYCRYYMPKLSEASQVILKVELAKYIYDFDDVLAYRDNDFIKTVSMEDYADILYDKDEGLPLEFELELEPTLYDYVMHCLIRHYRYQKVENELYEKLLDFDLKNNYYKAYYNNRIDQLGYINDEKTFNMFSQLAEECTDNEIVAKIKLKQIEYLTYKKEDYVQAKTLCDEIMALLDKEHQLYGQCAEYIQNITKKTIEVKLNKVYLPNMPLAVGLTYRNTTNPSYKIFKVSADEFLNTAQIRDKALYRFMMSQKPIAEKTVAIPPETDYKAHSSLIALPALKTGAYYLVFSNSSSFDNIDDLLFLPFQVSNLAFLSLETDDGMGVYVVNRDAGQPMQDVTAHFTEMSYSYETKKWERKNVGEVSSDNNGFLVAPKTIKNTYYIDLYFNNDTLLSTSQLELNKRDNTEDIAINSKIFTDRAIYRPGQTVQFKCIVYRGNSQHKEIIPNYKTLLKLRDANNQIIDTQHAVTDEYGAAHGCFSIPSDRLNGYFSIEDDHSTTSFRVEEYKRPTFEVTFNDPDKEYKVGDSLTVTGKVTALSGFGLDRVTYTYNVIRKTSFPFRFWDWTPYFIDDDMISSGEGTTLNDGSFEIDFQLLPSDDVNIFKMPRYCYELEVEATNKQGETQRATFYVTATYNKYVLSVETDEKPSHENTTIDIKDFKDLNVTASNINGRPAKTLVECKIFKINDYERYPMPFASFDRQLLSGQLLKVYFPHFDYYAKEAIDKDIVYQDTIDVDGRTPLLPNNLRLSPAQYIIELRSVDDTLSVFSERYVVYDKKSKKMPYKSMYWTHIDKESAQPGETIEYIVGSSEKNVSALVVIKSGARTIMSKRISLNNSIYKLSYKVKEEDRGRLDFQVAIVKHNTEMCHADHVDIPYNNLDLDIVLHTERNKLLPGETETWGVTVKDYKDRPVAVPLMATMYDAALDNFQTLNWSFNTKPSIRTGSLITTDNSFGTFKRSQYFYNYYFRDIPKLIFSDIPLIPHSYTGRAGKAINMSDIYSEEEMAKADMSSTTDTQDNPPAKIRKDFNETAFFYPELKTDENGSCSFTFTMPDALTRWNMKLLAYSSDLKTGYYETTVLTQQPLMIMADMPRFVYDEDTLWVAANVINLSDETLSPNVRLEVFDDNNNPIELILSDKNINISEITAGRSQSVRWKVAMQKDVNPLVFRFSAITEGFSDAEQHLLPVLSTEVFMTQTYSLTVDANTSKEYVFNISNDEERNHDIRLNFNANPVFYVIQALPYLAEGDEKYATTAFNRYFTNKMAQEILESNPDIREMLKDHSGDTLSELEKNEEVKAILLKETPWVLDAQNETRQRSDISKLLDTAALSKNIASALDVLDKKQTVNGGWPWIEGLPESEYFTQYILYGLGRLGDNSKISEKAFHFIEDKVIGRYAKLDTPNKKNNAICDFMTMKDIVAMSYYPYATSDRFEEAKTFYIKKLHAGWRRHSQEEQAHIALVLNRNGYKETASLIIRSLRERAIRNEQGMYWRNISVESQARILEAFNEIDPKTEEIDAMRLWILTQKRTNMWENERASVEAIFSIMNRGDDWTDENAQASMTVDDQSAKVVVDNKSDHVVWGGVFRQYFVPVDKVQKHNDAMKIKREFFVKRTVDKNNSIVTEYVPVAEEDIKVGDEIKTVICFENSQDMEFVYLKDLRGACFEPTEQISRYQWDDGLWYYQSTSDVAMEFFFERLPKGKHKLSYTVHVAKEGRFSTGYAVIQCQYAPEFGAYSNGERVAIGG